LPKIDHRQFDGEHVILGMRDFLSTARREKFLRFSASFHAIMADVEKLALWRTRRTAITARVQQGAYSIGGDGCRASNRSFKMKVSLLNF
jgi:hypothetical protein